MSVYKEALHLMAALGQRQTRIFNDACDYGIPIRNEHMDPAFAMIQQLKEMYWDADTDKREVIEFSCGTTVKLTMSFLDEWNTGKEIPCVITYTRQDIKRSLIGDLVGIITIDCEWAETALPMFK